MEKRLIAAILLTALLLVGSAGAAPVWLEPDDVSIAGEQVISPRITLDADGNAIAAWSTGNTTPSLVKTAFRPVGGPWEGEETVSDPLVEARHPNVAFDGSGNALLVWEQDDEGNKEIQASFRPAGGGWETTIDLSTLDRDSREPEVAFDGAGNALVVWSEFDGTSDYIVMARERTAEGEWQTAVPLSPTGGDGEITRLALNADGDAVAGWRWSPDDAESDTLAQVAYRPAGDGWEAEHDLSGAGACPVAPEVALDSSGNAVAVWEENNCSGTYAARTAFRPAAGPWGASEDLSDPATANAFAPQVAMDGDGNAVAVWEGEQSGDPLQVAERPATGTWSAGEDLSPAGGESHRVEFDGDGNALAVWSGLPEDGDANQVIQGSYRPAGGDWSTPEENISDPGGGNLDLAFDAAGNAAVIWETFGDHAQATAFDVAAPELRNVQVPGTGFARQRLTFSVEPFDWALDGEPLWRFGDGTTATGRAVTHTYSAPKTYNVSVEQLDAAGNETTELRQLTISVVKCFGSRATKVGSSGNDMLSGGGGADVIVALGGADEIRGRGGNDKICAGGGPDHLYGQAGNDSLNGQAGNDLCHQGTGTGRHVSC